MTPFELALESELNIEWQKFANEWLFKWHSLNVQGMTVDVDRFDGGRIRYGGIQFGHQQQQIFWEAINRYLDQKIHEIFKRWDADTAAYPTTMRKSSIAGVERILRVFVQRIIERSVDTDRRVRGAGYPQDVTPFDSTGNMSKAHFEILRLAEAHRALVDEKITKEAALPAQLSRKQRIETFLSNHRGILTVVGIGVAVVFGVLKMVVG